MRLILSLLMLVSGNAFAQAVTTNLDEMRSEGLPPHQLQAINAIGATILQAKQMGVAQTDPNDKDLLNQLQATVDKLIAAENLSKSNISLSTDQQAVAAANNQQAVHDADRKASQQAAWDVVGKLHQESGQLQASSSGKAKREIISGGMPIGEQRGRQYQEWAAQLETAINNSNGPERIGQLLALQTQLHPVQHGVTQAPVAVSTPSLQAMTWDEPPAVENPQRTAGSGSSGKKHTKH